MNQAAMLEVLSSSPAFRKGSVGLLESICRDSSIKEFKIKTEIMREGAGPGEEGYIILEGSADVFIGGEHVTTLRRGEVFGEYAPIFRQNRTATIITNTALKCLILDKRSLLQLIGHGAGLNSIIFRRIDENRKNNRGIFKNHS